MNEQPDTTLLAEQMKHLLDLYKADLEAIQREQEHNRAFAERRLSELEKARDDHETRIRSLQDGATTFKTWSGLASGGSSLMAIIAFIKAFFGG